MVAAHVRLEAVDCTPSVHWKMDAHKLAAVWFLHWVYTQVIATLVLSHLVAYVHGTPIFGEGAVKRGNCQLSKITIKKKFN